MLLWLCFEAILMFSGKVQVVSDESGLQSYINQAGVALDSQLQNLMPIISNLRLHKQIEYALQTKGKGLRSTMVLLAGESVGAEKQNLEKLALGIELLHLATLVHDDILDQDLFRRNALSVQAKWSVKEAILVGDALASLGLNLGRDYGKEVLDVMANTCLQLTDGEFMDVKITTATLSEEYYLEKIRKKSASLFKAAAECGAIAGNGSKDEISSLGAFGENYGLAFQIRDDLSDVLSSENEVLSDLNEFRSTLPLICLDTKSSKSAQTLIKKILASKKKNGEGSQILFQELEMLLDKSGSIDYCHGKIGYYVREAISILDLIEESPCKNYLKEMAKSLTLK
jgi:geranylgeranyl pyrophosphate synthase